MRSASGLVRPRRDHRLDIRAFVYRRPGGGRGEFLVEAGIARAVIGDAAGRVEFDGLERSEKRPAQTQSVLDGVIEIFRRNIAFTDQPECFGEQRALAGGSAQSR